MWVFLFVAGLLVVVNGRIIENCSGVVIHGIKHDKEVLKSGLDSPYQLAIDHDTNYLFFSYSTPHDMNDGFKSGYINLKTNEFGVIRGITGGFANAVDSKSHIVYLGGNDGIYKFDFNTKRANFVGVNNTSIWQLFFKDKLYFTDYPSESAFTFEGGMSRYVPQLRDTHVVLMAVDKNNDIFFSNATGLYKLNMEKSKIVKIGEYNLNGFAGDLNDNVYFSTPDGIYLIDSNTQDVNKLSSMDNVYGIAIESDGSIIYADEDSIVRLKPTKERCFRGEANHLDD